MACWPRTASSTVTMQPHRPCGNTGPVREPNKVNSTRIVCKVALNLARANERLAGGIRTTTKNKMTRGVLIFAFNNEQTDYLAMAGWSARNIRQHLGLPVAVVTDCVDHERNRAFDRVINVAPQTGGTRYFEDYAATVSWHNAGRTDAYSLTPWDETLVLDADYVVDSDNLNRVWDSKSDFMCYKNAFDMSTGTFMRGLNSFGQYDMPMWWATVMMFRKSNTAQYIFDCMNMIRDNWQHYRDLYGISKSTYRNDFALSIALGIVSGHTGVVDEIPGTLLSVMPDTVLTKDELGYNINFADSDGKQKYISFSNVDFHAMGKKHLGAIIEAS